NTLGGLLDLALELLGDLVVVLLDELAGLVDQGFRVVADLLLLAALLVLLGVSLGVLDHAVDLLLRQAGAVLDGDGVLLAGALVLGGDVDDAVGVDVEGDLDLWHATRRGGDTGELERPEQLVLRRHLALTLEDLD